VTLTAAEIDAIEARRLPADLALARRAVACASWRWMPGMRVLPDAANKPARCVISDERRMLFAIEQGFEYTRDGDPCVQAWSDDAISGEELPDLTDPATLGCLLALVREMWRDPLLYVARNAGIFEVCRGEEPEPACAHDCMYDGKTEAEALVTALENAAAAG